MLANYRKPNTRTTFLVLTALSLLSIALLFLHPVLSPSYHIYAYPQDSHHLAQALDSLRSSRLRHISPIHHHKHKPLRPPLHLDTHQELSAVSAFLTSHFQNVIPHSIDPTLPIDPHLVLDFDIRSDHAPQELQDMVDDVWLRNPVLLFSKKYSPPSREIKATLRDLKLLPEFAVIEIDTRDDASVLEPLLTRLTNSSIPILLVGGKSVGDGDPVRIAEMAKTGELQRLIRDAGADVGVVKGKGYRPRRGL